MSVSTRVSMTVSRQGDVVVMNQEPPDRNEWWNGTNTRSQQVGYFPGNYVRELAHAPGQSSVCTFCLFPWKSSYSVRNQLSKFYHGTDLGKLLFYYVQSF